MILHGHVKPCNVKQKHLYGFIGLYKTTRKCDFYLGGGKIS